MTAREAGRPWRRQVGQVLAEYGDRCHLCLHGGSESADHLVPVAKGGANDVANLRPVHHRPCPVCGLRCNVIRGDRPLTPRLIASFRRRPVVDGRRFFSPASQDIPRQPVRPSPK